MEISQEELKWLVDCGVYKIGYSRIPYYGGQDFTGDLIELVERMARERIPNFVSIDISKWVRHYIEYKVSIWYDNGNGAESLEIKSEDSLISALLSLAHKLVDEYPKIEKGE